MLPNNKDLVNSLTNEAVKKLINSVLEDLNGAQDLNNARITYCKDCKHRPILIKKREHYSELEFPDDKCPCRNDDGWLKWTPKNNWFCRNGEKKDR